MAMNKKIVSTIALSSLTAAMLTLTGCGSSSGTDSAPSTGAVCPAGSTLLSAETTLLNKTTCLLDAAVNADMTLTNDKIWSLGNRLVMVGNDTDTFPVLTIDAGTTVYGQVGGALVIQRGAKIEAVGTDVDPIIMTGEAELMIGDHNTRGQWAGLVIAGKAPNNNIADSVAFEFDATIMHGGTDPLDNSGTLKYVIVKHAGQPIVANKEFNTITLGSVGAGTTIDYVEAFNGKDDGIELFGGNVNMKHLVLIGNDDDQLDTDEGYNGFVQYVYAETTTSGEADPSAFEFSNTNSANYGTTTYFAEPKVANFTIVGAPLADMNASASFSKYNGIRTKDETNAKFVNGVVSGFAGIENVSNSGLWHQADVGTAGGDIVTFAGTALEAQGVAALAYANNADATRFGAGLNGNSDVDLASATAQDPQAVLGDTAFIETTNVIGADENTWATGWAIKADGTNF